MVPQSTKRCAKHYADGWSATQTFLVRLRVGGGKMGAQVPKAQRLKCCGRGPQLRNTENASGV